MNFLNRVTSDLISKGWDHLQHYTLVFPMRRAALFAKQNIMSGLRESGYEQPVFLPGMCTLDDLVTELCPMNLSDEIRAICRLYKVYARVVDQSIQLDTFYGWGKQLLDDFSSVDMALKDAYQIIDVTAAAKNLETVELDEDIKENLNRLMNITHAEDSAQEFFIHLWDKLPDIYREFTAEQVKAGVGTKGACYKWVVEHYGELQCQLEGRVYVFVGFNYLLPAERELMSLLAQSGHAIFYWDDDPSFTLDASVYQYIRENIRQFGNACQVDDGQSEVKSVKAIATVSATAQAQYVGQWLKENHHPGERTAVVIADESMLEPVLYCLPGEVSEQVNVTKGYPLKNTQIYAEVVTYLSDKKHDRLSKRESYAVVLNGLTEYLQTIVPKNTDSRKWQDILLIESYCQVQLVINHFTSLFAEGILDDVNELRTLRNLLRRSLDTISLPFHGEPLVDIQVIGVLETRLLEFDNLLILNVEEGIVPRAAADHSFIPFDIRKAYRMQTHEDESKIFAYNFFRLIRRGKNITMMFSEAAGDMTKKSMSRFLMQMLLSPDFQVTKYRISESMLTEANAEIVPNRTWLETAKNGQLYLSPSALSDYIECPRKFYLQRIMGVRTPDSDSLILQPNELGTLYHGAMKAAYTMICGDTICEGVRVTKEMILGYIDEQHFAAHIHDALVLSYQELAADYDKHHEDKSGSQKYIQAEHPAENEVVANMVLNTLRHDAEQEANIRLRRMEDACRFSIEIPERSVTVTVGGIIDRLDEITEGGRDYLRVLDYKTGGYSADKLEAESVSELFTEHKRHYALQTMIYSYIVHHNAFLNPEHLPIMPQLLFVQKLSADSHLSISKAAVMDIREYDHEFGSCLRTAIVQILDDTTWDKCDTKKCESSLCPFHILCSREKKLFMN